jgi:hypothetical protein
MFAQDIRSSRRLSLNLLLTGALLLVTASVAAAQSTPPLPDVPANGKLLKAQVEALRARLAAWKTRLVQTRTTEDVIKTRQRILTDYNHSDAPAYRTAFDQHSQALLAPLMDGKGLTPNDPLASIKRINVAMAFSQMPSPGNTKILRGMIASKNQAIRFLGWVGFAKLRDAILRSGGKAAKGFSSLLGQAVRTEQNPLVLAKVLRMMDLRDAQEMDDAAKKAAQKLFFQAFADSWATRRAGITAKATPQGIQAAELLISALTALQKGLPADAATRQKSLQMILDLAASNANAYAVVIKGSGQPALQAAMEKTLLTCEAALNAIAATKHETIAKALKETVGRGPAVREAALVTWVKHLKSLGVTTPK